MKDWTFSQWKEFFAWVTGLVTAATLLVNSFRGTAKQETIHEDLKSGQAAITKTVEDKHQETTENLEYLDAMMLPVTPSNLPKPVK